MKKLFLALIMFMLLGANCQAFTVAENVWHPEQQQITKQMIKEVDIQPWLTKYIKKIILTDREKFNIQNGIKYQIIAESSPNGKVTIYRNDNLKITRIYLEEILRHEIGHIVYWKMGYDCSNNTEEGAEAFRVLSKDCQDIIELQWIMRFLGYWQ